MKKTPRIGHTLALAAAAVTLGLSGCGNTDTSDSDATPAATLTHEFPSASPATPEGTPPSTESSSAATAEIRVKGFEYLDTEPVSPGTIITVTNEDIEAHTITADTGTSFDLSINPGTATFTAPTTPGTYPYHCIFHGNMKGTLTVK